MNALSNFVLEMFSRGLFKYGSPSSYKNFHARFPRAAKQLTTLQGTKDIKPVFGGIFRGDVANHPIKYLYLRGFFEWESLLLCKAVVSPSDTIIEVGGNVGTETLAFCRYVPNGHVYCFEPDPGNVKEIETNAKLNKTQNLDVIPHPVSDGQHSYAAIGLNKLNTGTVFMKETPNGNLTSTSLDQYLGSISLNSPIAYLHVDCEGFEYKVLNGAKTMLQHHNPTIYLEINPKYIERAGDCASSIFTLLKALEYQLFWLDEDTGALQEISRLGEIRDRATDWICIHASRIKKPNFLDDLRRLYQQSHADRKVLYSNLRA